MVLGAMILFWRLSEGRMSMSEISKGITSVLSMPEQKISIEVESAKLTWSDWKNPLGVILYHAEVQTPGGTLILPELEVGLDLTELFFAEMMPQVIRLEKPKLRWNPIKTGIPFFPLQSWESDSQIMLKAIKAQQESVPQDVTEIPITREGKRNPAAPFLVSRFGRNAESSNPVSNFL
mgnify:CR=1 FL=1